MTKKQKKTILQAIKWWWNTRVMGFWRVKVAGYVNEKVQGQPDTVVFNDIASPMPAPSAEGITVILTAYRRAEYLPEQIKALRAQTIPPKEIWVWSNKSEDELRDVSALADRVVVSNSNFLFWGRFGLATLVRTGYVAFFDDDILPQPRWFENCLATIEGGYDGILGGSGVILPESGGYSSKNKAGWNGLHSESPVEVDLVGHAWFMRKEYVQYMWREEPASWDNGEDIHLGYMALKHGNIKTYVPPHPEEQQEVWSCRPDFGKIVGRLNVATYKTVDHKQTRTDIVDQYREDGWKITELREVEPASPIKLPPITQKKTAQLVDTKDQAGGDSTCCSSPSCPSSKGSLEKDETISKDYKQEPLVSEPAEKDFIQELQRFNQMIKNDQAFSLVRFGDGEMIVINGEAIDLSEKCNGEHRYTPNNERDEQYRKILEESLLFENDQYFVGLPCRCCVGDEHCDSLRAQSKQDEKQLTWANIFVNANYPSFLKTTLPILEHKTVNIVCHEKADVSGLPFSIQKDFRVGANAWVDSYDRLIQELRDYLEVSKVEGQVFIFCAGVLSNMLIYQLTKDFPENTYIDAGSVFDDMMNLGQTRKYLKGSRRRLKKVCIW